MPSVLAVGEEHRHLGLAVGELAHHALHGGPDEPAVGAVDDLERHPVQAGARPLLGQLGGGFLVDREVHGAQLVGRERAGVLDGAGRRHVEPVDEHQHDVAAQDRRGGGGGTSCSSSLASCSYWRLSRSSMTTNSGITINIIQASSNRVMNTITTTKAEITAPTPLRTRLVCQPGSLQAEVVLRHAGLREREADEHADGVERDEPRHRGVGDDHEDGGGAGQGDDAVREHEPVAALGELPRQEAVAGLEAGEAREVGEAGVGGQHEDQHGGGLEREAQHLADGAGAVDGLADLGEHGGRALLERAAP